MFNKVRVLATGSLFLALLVLEIFFAAKIPAAPQVIDVRGYPMQGSEQAPIQMVIFEDLLCTGCKEFHLKMLPQIRERYIDSGQLQCSLVLLAFLKDSPPLGRIALALHEHAPSLFFAFVDRVFHGQPMTAEGCLQLLQNEYLVDAESIKATSALPRIDRLLKQSDSLADRVMGDDFGTPTIFINGLEVKDITLERLTAMIETALQNQVK